MLRHEHGNVPKKSANPVLAMAKKRQNDASRDRMECGWKIIDEFTCAPGVKMPKIKHESVC